MSSTSKITIVRCVLYLKICTILVSFTFERKRRECHLPVPNFSFKTSYNAILCLYGISLTHFIVISGVRRSFSILLSSLVFASLIFKLIKLIIILCQFYNLNHFLPKRSYLHMHSYFFLWSHL